MGDSSPREMQRACGGSRRRTSVRCRVSQDPPSYCATAQRRAFDGGAVPEPGRTAIECGWPTDSCLPLRRQGWSRRGDRLSPAHGHGGVQRWASAWVAAGTVRLTRVPFPSSLSIRMLPPCSSTSRLVMAKPRPVPLSRSFQKCANVLKWRIRGAAPRAAAASHAALPGGGPGVRLSRSLGGAELTIDEAAGCPPPIRVDAHEQTGPIRVGFVVRKRLAAEERSQALAPHWCIHRFQQG